MFLRGTRRCASDESEKRLRFAQAGSSEAQERTKHHATGSRLRRTFRTTSPERLAVEPGSRLTKTYSTSSSAGPALARAGAQRASSVSASSRLAWPPTIAEKKSAMAHHHHARKVILAHRVWPFPPRRSGDGERLLRNCVLTCPECLRDLRRPLGVRILRRCGVFGACDEVRKGPPRRTVGPVA